MVVRRVLTQLATVMLAALGVVALSAAGLRVGMTIGATIYEQPEQLGHALARVARTGEQVPLRELTGFDWDRVHAFPPHTPAEEVFRTVGRRVTWKGSYARPDGSGVLVFVEDQTVVRAIRVRPEVLNTEGRSSWGRAVLLVPTDDERGALRLWSRHPRPVVAGSWA